ncbi:hypothetical protein N7495_003684 [Penicillium taxi]|uniref:uncharacterized protein n=1 Tax=Penicillium taxi TaxID=168475 RepID=UPI0025453DF0|nr:uncharacterized protein N7495_003684 [Penicillium taxi]KAJ5898940.1 hypothetical protein N7495_003684 [Penicillium taxi]
MQSYKGSDYLDTRSASRSRSTSISSDSQYPRVNLMSPPAARPAPAFISSTSACEIITSDQEFNAADFVAENEETGTAAGANAVVTPAALSLLNGFLDNLIYSILAESKSTQLSSIRPILADVLKPRLAQEVVDAADEELKEYMGDEFRDGQESGGDDFDLIRAWKLTRLRCMVYTRLGDMEEEDEDEFIAQESFEESDGPSRRFANHVDNITPAAAIFLTSIIEYIGERALVIAGETARSRLSAKLNDNDAESFNSTDDRKRIDRLIVEDLDMEKLALNATLGRLWRTWRKRRRGNALSRTLSRESFRRRYSLAGSRKSSIATIEEPLTPNEHEPPIPVDPSTVPLPITNYDVQEIEVPGFSIELEEEVQTMQAVVAHKVRPRSLMVFSSPAMSQRSPRSPRSMSSSPPAARSPVVIKVVKVSPKETAKARHSRSRSLPNAAPDLPEEASEAESEVTSADQASPSEEKKQLETMYEDEESAEYVDAVESPAPATAITSLEKSEAEIAEPSENARMPIVHEEAEEAGHAASETIGSSNDDVTATDNSHISVSSLSDEPIIDSEPVEGRGSCEQLTLTSANGQSSRDVSNVEPIIAETSEPDMQTPKIPQSMQGAEWCKSTPPSTVYEAVESGKKSDQNEPIMATLTETDTFEEEVSPNTPNTPRQTSPSVDSVRSKSSRTPPQQTPAVGASRIISPTERAAVQRVPIRSTSVSPPMNPNSRRSESISSARDKRPITSGSTTSQVSSKLKGLMARQLESPSQHLRTSSETSRVSAPVAEDVEDFDRLIKTDETIHFTLTPKSVREMTFPDNSPGRPLPRDTDISPNGELKTPTGDLTANFTESPVLSHSPLSPLSPLSPRANSPAKVIPPPRARDARTDSGSTRDFANFVKSSGPTGVQVQQTNSPAASIKSPIPPPRLSTSTVGSNSNRPRLQARAPEVKSSGTSELIDFIREGPPQAGNRIPRSVAPFRNTAASDAYQNDYNNEGVTRTSIASHSENKSMTSLGSLGSRTGLLESSNRSTGYSKSPASRPVPVQDEPMPIRKQRRVRDPYAIDDSDEDEELLEEIMNAKPKRQEESLMDFLRDAPPPPSAQSSPQPFAISDSMKSRALHASMSTNSLRSESSPNPRSQSNNYTLKVGMERNPGPARQTETSALADFLRNTAPPVASPAPRTISTPTNSKTKEGSISRFFGRRKKVEA